MLYGTFSSLLLLSESLTYSFSKLFASRYYFSSLVSCIFIFRVSWIFRRLRKKYEISISFPSFFRPISNSLDCFDLRKYLFVQPALCMRCQRQKSFSDLSCLPSYLTNVKSPCPLTPRPISSLNFLCRCSL